ncbi:bacterioferritin-associated ferredoxin [Aquitalea magnusonii]|uniref:bacterioferritin-associated ferredoxin n=1 Tax=Aquitalea magnusonii TaxID=332411 RepID=UPI0009EADAA1
MYVCLCNAVTDSQIRQAVEDGATRMCDLRAELGVAAECGKCACCANQLRKETLQQLAASHPARAPPDSACRGRRLRGAVCSAMKKGAAAPFVTSAIRLFGGAGAWLQGPRQSVPGLPALPTAGPLSCC